MAGFDIAESQVLKKDACFQLRRVITHYGDEFLVKVAVTDDRGNEERLLEREFQLLRSIGSSYGLTSIRFERLDGRLAALYGPFDGVPLTPCPRAAPADLGEFLKVAGDICAIFDRLHEHGSILLGVSPSSFLRSPRTNRLLLADAPFAQAQGAAVDRSDEYWLESPYLAYAAPEVIGGGLLPLDHRADLYSLGGLLYHLLSRRPLFDSTDPVEVIQCHVAREPRHLWELVPSVPRAVADAVMKLLAKDPQDRFPSVEAFEHAVAAHIPRRRPRPPSRPGSAAATALSFSTGLYGHSRAADLVRERCRGARTRPAIVFIEGEAGIGKTTLLRAVRRHQAACFCGGDFLRSSPATPLRGWVAALIELANLVLTRRTDELEDWRARIARRIGEWAPLIAALAPEWQTILQCPAPPARELLNVSLNRLALAIHRLIACYASAQLPVVVVLDDLQWADSSSLRILELLLAAPEPLNLVVLAAVRDGEGASGEVAALRELRAQLRSSDVDTATLHLDPWTRADIAGFVTDSLEHPVEDADQLAGLILAKTHGNPFFVRELLRDLVQRETLVLQADRWRWDPQALRGLPVTENVVAFLSRRIANLPPDVKDALRIAACLGRELSLADFGLVSGPQPELAQQALLRAVAEGLLVQRGASAAPAGTSYEFVHDRVLEAAHGLLSSDDSAAAHLRIGRILSQHQRDADERRTYKVASHFNLARRLIEQPAERYRSAELDLQAGRLARLRGAFSQALEFLQAGLAFLASHRDDTDHQDAWRDQFSLTLALHEETAEVALLGGQLAVTNRLCGEILARARSPLQKVFAYEIRICSLKAEKKFPAAVDAALEILRELGVHLANHPTTLRVAIGFLATRRRVFAGPISRLAKLPALRDDRIKAAGRIIQTVYSAAYLGRPNLFPLLVYRHVSDSLEHGNEDYSGVTYTAFAVVLSAMGQVDRAIQLGTVGLDLIRTCNADRLKARAFMAYYTFVFPWRNHIRDILPYYREGLDAGLAHGDFEYASYIMTLESLARLHAGDPLAELQPDLERHGAKLRSLGQERSILLQNMLCQMVLALRHGPEDTNPLSGRFYDEDDEAQELPRCLKPLDENLVFHNHLAKLTLGLFLGDHAAAVDAARRGRAHLHSGGFGNYLVGVFLTYESLVCLISPPPRGRAGAVMRRVRHNQRRLERWSRGAPMNFLHRYHLVEAERCRVTGDGERAATHFEKAIELSQSHGFVHETGLAQERAAAFYFDRGMDRLGRQYLRDCYASYRKWGAEAVTRRLESRHAQQFAILACSTGDPVRGPAARFAESLDYRMLLRSSQAISGEVLLPRLLERLLENILEHAGAQRAILVLDKRSELYVEAEADVDERGTRIIGDEPVEDSDRLCRAIVQYSARMTAPVVLADAAREGLFVADPYVRNRKPRSVLCTPVLYQGKPLGLIYLENNRVSHVFTEARLEVVNLLAGQAAISIANARAHALELEAQQAKINPHFLFNALSSIADLAVSDGGKAETAIVKLATLYRYILTSSLDDQVTLEQELEIVRNYLTLEKLRFGARLEYSVTVEGDATCVKLPGLLIQPLVENSIRHGLSGKLTPGTVSVHAVVRGARCCIVVQDDGEVGKVGTGGTGFGLRSIQERLALAYGQGFSFAISRSSGYRVEIEIPIVNQDTELLS